ncbi:lipoprotein signal peptidase [Enterococcus saigonensis]|uniref:Lipoprotein signal peptidase n=1 Tax=Enterococcus saigonensis TaxID=1805431 RepID=A0A679IBX7_9ENTE|nr:signal peptidase II [Enterococcus saigonensis]BCA85753.1 lipoprotein signal peptidase [Enterococcus saigonensis]
MILFILIAVLLITIDQIVKAWIVANISLGTSMSVIKNVFSLTYYQNTGAAWSMLEGQIIFFAIVTIIAVGVCGYLLYKNRNGAKIYSLGLSLVLAGALGNFIDRMRLGYVVDMFQTDFVSFPIFNVADSCLVIGVILIFVYILFEERFKGVNA